MLPNVNIFKWNITEDANLQVATFFYKIVISFNATKDTTSRMCVNYSGDYGFGFTPPSWHEIRTK